MGQREIWIHIDGALVIRESGLGVCSEMVPVALCQELQGFQRRTRRLLQRLVELGYGRQWFAELVAQLRCGDAPQVHDFGSARRRLLDLSERYSPLTVN